MSRKNVAFFLGSGCSVESGIPSVHELKETLVKRFQGLWPEPARTLDFPLERIAGKCQRLAGRRPMIDALELSSWLDRVPNETHELLAALCRENLILYVITTNWDNLIEQALRKPIDLHPIVVLDRDDMPGSGVGPTVIKPHGCVTRQFKILITRPDLRRWDSRGMRSLIETILRQRWPLFIGISGDQPLVASTVMNVLNEIDEVAYKPVWVSRGDLGEAANAIQTKFSGQENHYRLESTAFLGALHARWCQRKIDEISMLSARSILDVFLAGYPEMKLALRDTIGRIKAQLSTLDARELNYYFRLYAGRNEEPYLTLTTREEKFAKMLFWLAFCVHAFEHFESPIVKVGAFRRSFHLTGLTSQGSTVNVFIVDCDYRRGLDYLRTSLHSKVGQMLSKPNKKYFKHPHALYVITVGDEGQDDHFALDIEKGERYEPILLRDGPLFSMITSGNGVRAIREMEGALHAWIQK